jgi:MoaD family protein
MENEPKRAQAQVVLNWVRDINLKVKVQYFASVRELVNLREEVIEVPSGTTVRGLLDLLATKHGARLGEYLLDAYGNPRSHLQFIINEKSISEAGGLSTVFMDGYVFAIIPPVGGG